MQAPAAGFLVSALAFKAWQPQPGKTFPNLLLPLSYTPAARGALLAKARLTSCLRKMGSMQTGILSAMFFWAKQVLRMTKILSAGGQRWG